MSVVREEAYLCADVAALCGGGDSGVSEAACALRDLYGRERARGELRWPGDDSGGRRAVPRHDAQCVKNHN